MIMQNTPVCKFFQNNSCKFGNKCKFLHVYNEISYGNRSYSYDSKNKTSGMSILQKGRSPLISYQQNNDVDISTLSNELIEAFKAAEKGGIWPLSCFSLIPTYGNISGLDDYSPEELRLKAYVAKESGNFQSYVTEVQSLLSNRRMSKDACIKNSNQLINEYIKQINNQNSFSSGVHTTDSDFSTVFFNSKTAPTNMEYQSVPTTNIFGQVPQKMEDNSVPSFGEEHISNSFKQNVFGKVTPPAFGSEPSNFGQSNVFNKNLFGQVFSSKNDSKATMSSAFSSSSEFFHKKGKTKNYSDVNSLTNDELEQFKATTFTYGKVPVKPPPLELCL